MVQFENKESYPSTVYILHCHGVALFMDEFISIAALGVLYVKTRKDSRAICVNIIHLNSALFTFEYTTT